MVVLLAILCLAAFCLGRYPLDVSDVLRILASRVLPLEPDWDPLAENVVLVLRMPRIAASLLVGGALALSGACYQGVFKNPLVSPDLLGVSAGAGVGAALAILLGLGTLGTQAFAFVLGMTTVLLATSIPKILRNASVTMLVLSGIIMSGVMNSLMGVMKYLADPETQLASITYWQMGSLAKVTDKDVLAIFPWIFLCSLALVAVRWRINLLSLGDNEARALGVNVRLVRGIVIFCATLLTACSVSVSGTIGWVGLVIPHLARTIAGPDNVRAVPASLVLGAGFMLFVDTAARVLIEAEIPLSILTGLIGAPFFFFVLAKQRMKLS
jgi:iron complex transport system permease protein